MAKIVVGMSGGVDSAVAAYLLKAAGHEVFCVTLRTWTESSRCCEIDDARAVCDMLSVPYYAVNCASLFRERVVEPFVEAYAAGNTPNPCIGCNRNVKWDQLMEARELFGAEYVATGHYAEVVRTDSGRFTVKNAACAAKDQTYMLYMLSQEQLAHTIMPLGRLNKEEVRRIASAAGLCVAGKKDSQEICFIPDDDYAGFVEMNAERLLPPGNFVDEQGNILGTHKGIIHYTVGQRKGLGIALGYPAYVKRIDPVRNEVVLSTNEELFTDEVFCRELNFLSIEEPLEEECFRASVRIRYHHSGTPAKVKLLPGGMARISFDSPVRAATPGQAAVFYDEDGCVIGGGTIYIPNHSETEMLL